MIRYWLVIQQFTGGHVRQDQYNEWDAAITRWEFAAYRAQTDWAHLVEIRQFSPPLAPESAPYLALTRRLVRSSNPIGHMEELNGHLQG